MKKIIKILENSPKVDEYRIVENKTTSKELFFIKDQLQMNRGKDVHDIDITVYKNFEIEGKKFKGSSTTAISPTMTFEEIEHNINQAALAASFVKNEYYDLEQKSEETAPKITSQFSDGNFIGHISKLVQTLYNENKNSKAFINSAEFFIDERNIRIINSNGIDVSYTKYYGEIELIVEANGEKESIELFDVLHFSDLDEENIKSTINESLKNAALRAVAVPMPNVENLPVVISGPASCELWEYYTHNADASSKYNHLHENNVGDLVQKEAKGDKVTIIGLPYIKNSSRNSYYDTNGTFLKDTVLLKDGAIKTMSASKRFADYLNVPCTGAFPNFKVNGGSKSEQELREGNFLEVLKFSDFQIDPFTGDFGGEFRLGIYHKDGKEIPVTLGSIAGNIKEAQKNMFLSKETVQANHYIVPKLLHFTDVRIAGN